VANVAASAPIGVAAAVFVPAYAVLAPWRRLGPGRHVMAFPAAVGLLGGYTVLGAVWPHGVAATALRVIRVALLVALAALLVQRTWMVVRAQRGVRRARCDGGGRAEWGFLRVRRRRC
jgi:hypothetical protein